MTTSNQGELNNSHFDVVSDYICQATIGRAKHYMLTIARDGESPVRSIYFYDNAIDATIGYEAYKDWGFAKDYLTVQLYEPNGKLHSKVLRRPRGGECAFERAQYYQISDILNATKPKIDEETFNYLAYEFAKLFSRDNQRFNPERFLETLGYTGEINDRSV
jgi:hypothetical protein